MAKIQILSTQGCYQCAKAKEVIKEIKLDFPDLIVEEIDMLTPAGQKMLQKYQVMSSPGIIIDGELFSSGALKKDELIKKLTEKK